MPATTAPAHAAAYSARSGSSCDRTRHQAASGSASASDEQRDPERPELQEDADEGVLDGLRDEQVRPVDERLVLGAEPVAGDRPLQSLVHGALPGLRRPLVKKSVRVVPVSAFSPGNPNSLSSGSWLFRSLGPSSACCRTPRRGRDSPRTAAEAGSPRARQRRAPFPARIGFTVRDDREQVDEHADERRDQRTARAGRDQRADEQQHDGDRDRPQPPSGLTHRPERERQRQRDQHRNLVRVLADAVVARSLRLRRRENGLVVRVPQLHEPATRSASSQPRARASAGPRREGGRPRRARAPQPRRRAPRSRAPGQR